MLCSKHGQQFKKHGKVFDRTVFDRNEYIFEKRVCKIIITDRNMNYKCTEIIDRSNYSKVKNYKWNTNKNNTVTSGAGKDQKTLYHLIMGKPEKGYDIDHRNGDTLDNRKTNLRLCTHEENTCNSLMRSLNTSGFKGVSFRKDKNCYRGYIQHKGKLFHLGSYKTAKEAALVYDEAAIKYFGDFAKTNKMLGLL